MIPNDLVEVRVGRTFVLDPIDIFLANRGVGVRDMDDWVTRLR
jgi:hypothetical protein